MFTAYPTYNRYRTLKLASPLQRGEDVYALQTALSALGHSPGTHDGILGKLTKAAIVAAQEGLYITADGLAGPQTQTMICRHLANQASQRERLPTGLLYGQISHESSCRVGNYSPARGDGSYDAGVAQRNTAHTPAREGFTVPDSIEKLAADLRKHYGLYNGVMPTRRRWELAAGAWNAPAYASYIAREEGATGVRVSSTAKPSANARAALEAYMDSATAYLVL